MMKTINNSTNKTSFLLSATIYLIIMCATILGTAGIVANAEPQAEENLIVVDNDWYKISADGTMLTVSLVDYSHKGYKWSIGTTNDVLKYSRNDSKEAREENRTVFCMKPSGTEFGEVTLTFSCRSNIYAKNLDKKTLKLKVEKDKKIQVWE